MSSRSYSIYSSPICVLSPRSCFCCLLWVVTLDMCRLVFKDWMEIYENLILGAFSLFNSFFSSTISCIFLGALVFTTLISVSLSQWEVSNSARLLDSDWVSPLCIIAQKLPRGRNLRPSIIVLIMCISLFSQITILCCLFSNVLKFVIAYFVTFSGFWSTAFILDPVYSSCLEVEVYGNTVLFPSKLVKIFWNLKTYIILKKQCR